MRQISAEIESAHHLQAGFRFDRLGENFTENHLLGEIFRAHGDAPGAGLAKKYATASKRQQSGDRRTIKVFGLLFTAAAELDRPFST